MYVAHLPFLVRLLNEVFLFLVSVLHNICVQNTVSGYQILKSGLNESWFELSLWNRLWLTL